MSLGVWNLFRILTDETRSRRIRRAMYEGRIRGDMYEGAYSSASSQAVKLNGIFLLKILATFIPRLFVGLDWML